MINLKYNIAIVIAFIIVVNLIIVAVHSCSNRQHFTNGSIYSTNSKIDTTKYRKYQNVWLSKDMFDTVINDRTYLIDTTLSAEAGMRWLNKMRAYSHAYDSLETKFAYYVSRQARTMDEDSTTLYLDSMQLIKDHEIAVHASITASTYLRP